MNGIRTLAARAFRPAFALTLILAGLGAATPARAQGPDLESLLQSFGLHLKQEHGEKVVEISLDQVLKLVIERNLDLRSVRVGESVSESAVRAARGRFNPTLTNSLDYSRAFSPTSQGIYLGSDGASFNATVTKPTESGMQYSLSYNERSATGLSADAAGLTKYDRASSRSVTGAVSIPIGQDFGTEFNEIPLRRSEAGLEISRATSRNTELNLLQVAALTYWDLVAALENVRVRKEAVKLSEQLLADNKQRLQAGVLSPFDVQVTETQLARDKEQLVTAQADVLRIEDQARTLLNLTEIPFQVRPVDRPEVRPLPAQYPVLQRRVYDNSTQLRQLNAQLTSKELDLAEARNKERTNLDLDVFYTYQNAKDVNPSDINGYGATLTWTVPLFDVQVEETVKQRTLERQQIELQVESQRSQLDVSLQGLLRQIRVSTEQVDTSRRARELAEEQLKNEIERFRVGETTSFQVSQSQQAASEARVQEILAQLAFERNYLQLLVLTGDIYKSYGLTPEKP